MNWNSNGVQYRLCGNVSVYDAYCRARYRMSFEVGQYIVNTIHNQIPRTLGLTILRGSYHIVHAPSQIITGFDLGAS